LPEWVAAEAFTPVADEVEWARRRSQDVKDTVMSRHSP
jgi:hypothetical protein